MVSHWLGLGSSKRTKLILALIKHASDLANIQRMKGSNFLKFLLRTASLVTVAKRSILTTHRASKHQATFPQSESHSTLLIDSARKLRFPKTLVQRTARRLAASEYFKNESLMKVDDRLNITQPNTGRQR